MTLTAMLGYAAAFLTTASFLPQAILVIKTRNTEGLSVLMYSMFTTGVAGWLIYGILNKDWPIAIANLLTLIFALCILFIILMNKQKFKK
jgi:MtN3 and saliva related transmembrane protein